MNIIRLVFSVLMVFTLSSAFATNQIWEMEGIKVNSIFDNTENAYKSIECPNNGCFWDKVKNEKLLKKISLGKLSGGKNPGSDICKQIPQAKVILARNFSNQIQSFCIFSDKTFISSLAVYSEWLKQTK